MKGPPPEEERTYPVQCTTSPIAPLLDLAWVTYALAATAAEKSGGIGVEDVVLSSIWVGAAGYGIVNIVRCYSAKGGASAAADRARTLYQGRPGPQGLEPGPIRR